MSEAPERIWASLSDERFDEVAFHGAWAIETSEYHTYEYVRADRIEELEAKLARYDDLVADKINLLSENAALKAKLKGVEVDLRVINALDPGASMDECSRYTLTTIVGLMGGVTRHALAKLTGGKNE